MDNDDDLTLTPIVDKLIEFTKKNILSFHALPISRKKSISESALYEKYKELFGENYFASELTISGEKFDTPVFPVGLMKQSEEITAKAFGSKRSSYITMGTTTANRIVINSLTECGSRVLVDKSCHLSVHFSLKEHNCDITHIQPCNQCKETGRSHFDMNQVLEVYKKANEEGKPYKLVILNGYSYEGVFYDLKPLIKELVKINDDVSFLIDEAWFAFGYFHEKYKKYTAMHIASELQAEMPDKKICIVCTHSAHKSLSAFRQGSYIHTFGDSTFMQRIMESKFSIHTTSPSYPIIASLELARAHAVMEGKQLLDDALYIARYFCGQIAQNKSLSGYTTNETQFIDCKHKAVVLLDPLKISVNMSKLNIQPKEFIKFAFDKFGIYINRYCNTSMLINIHIGIKLKDITALLNAMEEFQKAVQNNEIVPETVKSEVKSSEEDYGIEAGKISQNFVIPYPPGVPILFKGDQITEGAVQKIKTLKENGVNLIIIK